MAGAATTIAISSLGISVILLGTSFSISIALIIIGARIGRSKSYESKNKTAPRAMPLPELEGNIDRSICQCPDSIAGIVNGGNSCYMASLFQAIYASSKHREAFFLPLIKKYAENIENFEARKRIQNLGSRGAKIVG